MKWNRWLLAATLSLGVAAVGCGDEHEPIEVNEEQNQDANQQNQDSNQQNNDEPDEFAEGVDIWVGNETGNEDVPTHLEVGETFGGRFDAEGSHHFSVDLQGGQALTISSVDFEADLEADLEAIMVNVTPHIEGGGMFQFGGPVPRTFLPSEHDEREFFVPDTNTYILEVQAGGEADGEYGFVFETGIDEVETQGGFEFPGTTDGGDLDDAQLDAYEVTRDELVSADIEVFAQRPPVASSLDAWLYVWDDDAGALVAESESQGEENLDPLATVDFEADATYWVVVDSVFNIDDAAYQLQTELRDTSETNRQHLSLDDVDEFDGQIQQRSGEPYFDYFSVTVEPGDYKKISVEGFDDLEPILQIAEESDDDDDGFFASGPSADALAVGNEAGATLGVADEVDEAVTFTVDLTDQRSLIEEDLDVYYGGDGFGYTVRLESADATAQTVNTGESTIIDLDSPGELQLLDVQADDGHLLWLDSGAELQDVDDVRDYDFIPAWAFADATTLETAHPITGFHWGQGMNESFLLRDNFFRGDVQNYDADIRIMSYDAESPDYQQRELKDGNESIGNAAALSVPALITGEYEEPEDDGRRMQQDGDGELDPEVHYFEFGVEAGDTVVAHTENDPINESNLSVLNTDGEELATSSLYMEQRQTGGDDDAFYDGAMVYEVEEDGDLILEVEQFCDDGFFGAFCDYGEVGIHVFVE